MKRFKVFIRRFEDVDAGSIYMDIEIRADKVKDGAAKVTASLNDIEKAVDKTINSLNRLPNNGTNAINKLKGAVQSLLEQSKKLDKQLSATGKQKYVTSGFASAKQNLQNKETIKKNQMGFTAGVSDDRNQLLKEVSYLQSSIQSKAKLINSEYQTRIKLVNQELADAKKQVDLQQRAQEIAEKTAQKQDIQAQKEAARAQAQAAKEQAAAARAQAEQANRSSFQASYTDLGPGNEALTQQYRAEFQALLEKLPAEQQSVAMKKLMAIENKKAVDSFVQEVAELKRTKLASTETVTGIDKLRDALGRLNARTDASKAKFKDFINQLRGTLVTWRIIGGFVKGIINTFANLYDKAAAYEEAINLYTVALGNYAEAGTKWANRISEALYLDPKQIMQYTGGFYNLVQGLGVGADAAYKMATNLTQLSYDMSSYLNIDVESAHDKIQSAITGQSRAVASAGIAMQQASLQELAYSMGIKQNVADMTQAEKTYLRYIQIMRSTTNMQSDLARTIVTPENALRVIRTQFELLGRAIGQVFIPIVLKVIPYIMILTEKLRELATWLAGLTGYKIADIDYSSLTTADTYLEGLGNTATDTAGKVGNAAKSISRSLAPFDELNVVESEGAGGGAGSGGGAGIPGGISNFEPFVDGYDMLAGLTDDFNNRLDTARQNFDKILDVVKLIGGAFLGWKLAKKFMEDYIRVSDFFDRIKKDGPIKNLFSSSAFTNVATAALLILDIYLNFKSVNDETDRFKQAWETGDWEEYFKIDSLDELIDKVRIFTFILQGGLPAAIVIAGNKLGWFDNLGKKVKETFKDLKEFIIDKVFKPISDYFEEIYNKHIKPTLSNIKYIYDEAIKPIWKDLSDSFIWIIKKIDDLMIKSGLLADKFKLTAEIIKTKFVLFMQMEFGNVINAAKTIIENFVKKIETITGTFKSVIQTIKALKNGDWKSVWTGVKDIIVNAFKGMITPIAAALLLIVKALETMINAFIGALQGVVAAINKLKIKIPDWIPKYGGKEFSPNLTPPKKISLGSEALKSFLRLKKGMDFIPKDYFGPVYLDYGERVLTKEENKEYMQGNTNYLNNLSRNSASSNNNQLVNDLANAIVNSMKAAEASRQPGITQVYIGNDKVYEGQGTYQNRQAERYGTNFIRI